MRMLINSEKKEVQHLGNGKKDIQIRIDGKALTQTERFVYLGGTIGSMDGSEGGMIRRIGLARGLFQNFNQVWTSKELSKHTKMRVYEVLILSALLYNSETWTLKENQKKRLRVLEMTFLRKIEGVTRRDRVRNQDIYTRLQYQRNVVQKIQQRRLRYFGHVVRMDPTRYPKVAMEGSVHGQRGRGRPKKRWMDMIEQDCEMLGLDVYNAKRLAQDRAGWRNAVEELSMRTNVSPRH